MRVFICSDAFKEAAEAQKVCQAIKRGIHAYSPSINVDLCPLADGGEGTAYILSQQLGGTWIRQLSDDPLGRKVEAGFGWYSEERIAFLDTAESSGLHHLAANEKKPLQTSTYGTGLLIRSALEKGAKIIYLGLGGSATNDGGTGMAAALGIRFYHHDHLIPYPTGKDLSAITRIDFTEAHPLLAEADIRVLADVRNPLFGSQGAAYIYGPQKGATPEQVVALDKGLEVLHKNWSAHGWSSVHRVPGAGAAGGLGAGSIVFLGGQLVPGAPTIFRLLQVEERFQQANLVLSGEGKLDQQSQQGKLIDHLGHLAQKTQTPLIVLCGQQELTYAQMQTMGITAAFAIQSGPITVKDSMAETINLLENKAAMIMATYTAS